MREIKFRFWDKFNKSFPTVLCLAYAFKEYEENPDRYISSQYTGLKDKNGKEIYEGDILYVKEEGRYGGEYNIPVEYASNWGCFGCACIRAKEISHHPEVENLFTIGFLTRYLGSFISLGEMTNGKFEFEIIGNIYENPNLLKDE